MDKRYQFINNPNRDIFRAYDIRGVVDKTLTEDVVYTIGTAIGTEAIAQGGQKIIICRDGRLSGPTLSQALCQGLLDSGMDVIDIGEAPTPVLYYATCELESNSGVMLTGSHNPADYNGLKIIINGCALVEAEILQLYERICRGECTTSASGQVTTCDIIAPYIQRIKNDIQLARPLNVVVDCGNGIAGKVAPNLLRAIGCHVIELFCEVDGRFPNHHPDPTRPENVTDMIAAIEQHQADIGLGFDGDGDRLGVVSDAGEMIWADRQLMLFAIDLLGRHPNSEIIFDVKSTALLPKIIQAHGGRPLMWKTGHSLIKTKMRDSGALLAGEMSGHIFLKERWYGFDDGLYVAARLLEIIAQDNRTVSEIFKALPDSVNTPEIMLPIEEAHKFKLMEKFCQQAHFKDARISKIDGLRADFDYGFGLMRPSNTTPNLVLRFEADSERNLKHIQKLFREQLLAVEPELELPF